MGSGAREEGEGPVVFGFGGRVVAGLEEVEEEVVEKGEGRWVKYMAPRLEMVGGLVKGRGGEGRGGEGNGGERGWRLRQGR